MAVVFDMSNFEFLSSNSHLEVVSHVMGVSGHHGRHLVIAGPWLPDHLLASDTGPGTGHHPSVVTRAAGLAHVLVPGGAGGLRHAAAALRGRGLEARAVS